MSQVDLHGDIASPDGDGPDWRDLLIQYLAALQRGVDWHEVWLLLIAHPWFQTELRTIVLQRWRRRYHPKPDLEDVRHEALVHLARALQRSPDLHIDLQRLDEFPGWVATIIRHCCMESLRRLCREDPIPPDEEGVPYLAAYGTDVPGRFELHDTLQHLPLEEQEAVVLRCEGRSLHEIAEKLGKSFWSVCHLLRNVREELSERRCA
jgi:RNA polymerase sigma factor (sigma-70 family)